MLKHHLKKAGVEKKEDWLKKVLFGLTLLLNMAISIYLFYYFANETTIPVIYVFTMILLTWTLLFFLLLALIWLAFYLVIDLRIFKRTKSVEEVLPDFLQLTATNIRAGMTIDKALWLAIRPRFGILAKEIEIVSKEVMSGEELTDALQHFADKYDSNILKKSVNLIIEGINAGSEIGDLLTRTAQNIQEVRTIQKEMSANVTSYAIFITFGAIVAAPVLLALSRQLIVVITHFTSRISEMQVESVITLQSVGITSADFHIFAILSTIITAFISALIVSLIKKGNIKEGAKYVPTFIITAITIYIISSKLLGIMLKGFVT